MGVLAITIVIGLPTLFFIGLSAYLFYGKDPPIFWDVSASPLTAQDEQALKPGGTFKECASCPEMVVVPAGSFTMGSPETQANRIEPTRAHSAKVTIGQPLAVGKFEVTLDEFYACTAHGGCNQTLSDTILRGGRAAGERCVLDSKPRCMWSGWPS